jgi:hypothetical protein
LKDQKASCRGRRLQALWIGAALTGAAGDFGCGVSPVRSDQIRTEGFFVDVQALAVGDGTTLVQVGITVAGANGTEVDLAGDDSLIADADGISYPLVQTGHGLYADQLDGDAARLITVRLERAANAQPGSSSAELPAPFALQIDNATSEGIDRSTALLVHWTGAGDPDLEPEITWSLAGSCIWPDSGTMPDDGVTTLSAEHLRVRPTERGRNCEVELALDREQQGDVDPVFVPGSSFRATQHRSVTFTSLAGVGEPGGYAHPTPPGDTGP